MSDCVHEVARLQLESIQLILFSTPSHDIQSSMTSLFFLYERVCDLFAAVHGRDNDEEGAAGDNEAEFAVADVAFVICAIDC